MDDGFVHRGPRRAEIGVFGVRSLALQNIDRGHRFAAFLIGDCPFDNRPMDTAGSILAGLVDNIFETPVDHGFKSVEPLLGFPKWCFAASSLRPVSRVCAGLTTRPGTAVSAIRGSPAATAGFRAPRPLLLQTPALRLSVPWARAA
jgi:hypothetical protein